MAFVFKTIFSVAYAVLSFVLRSSDEGSRGYEVYREGDVMSYNPSLDEPAGLLNYSKEFVLVGSSYVRNAACRFARDIPLKVSLKLAPGKNAIQVIGHTKDYNTPIGFLPKGMAKKIAEFGIADQLDLSLRNVYVAGSRAVQFRCVLLGPKSHRNDFRGYTKKKVADVPESGTSS
jgi:hypothetical protein|tara:strand:- start:490 stop:1014 length:525 start_codon:yes stop_codon:yes gene_type:complete